MSRERRACHSGRTDIPGVMQGAVYQKILDFVKEQSIDDFDSTGAQRSVLDEFVKVCRGISLHFGCRFLSAFMQSISLLVPRYLLHWLPEIFWLS